MYDVVIIGSGPAGLTAALYTGRARLKTLILESGVLGGNAAITDLIENYPGFPFGVDGSELMQDFWRQAERFGAELRWEEVRGLEIDGESFVVKTNQQAYTCRSIIIASGARRRQLQIPGEQEYMGRGVSYCATCDGSFFQGVPVAVVGGGDSAVKEALYLSDIASKVYLIHRRDEFRANLSSMERLHENHNIELKTDSIVRNIDGQELMNRLLIENIKTGLQEELFVEGLFVSIGLVAASSFFGDLLETREGYIITDENMQTSIPGVFAAGDIRWKTARQVATAVGDGALAGIAVTEYLKE